MASATTEEAKLAAAAVWAARIKEALKATGYHRAKACERLGIPKKTFYRRVKELNGLGLLDWVPDGVRSNPAVSPGATAPVAPEPTSVPETTH